MEKKGSDHFRDILNPYGEKSNYGKIGRRPRLSKLNVFFSIILSVTIYIYAVHFKWLRQQGCIVWSPEMGSKWNVRYGLGSIWFPWRLGDHREMTVFHMGEVSCSQILGELGGSLRFTLKSLLIQKMPMEKFQEITIHINSYGNSWYRP